MWVRMWVCACVHVVFGCDCVCVCVCVCVVLVVVCMCKCVSAWFVHSCVRTDNDVVCMMLCACVHTLVRACVSVCMMVACARAVAVRRRPGCHLHGARAGHAGRGARALACVSVCACGVGCVCEGACALV